MRLTEKFLVIRRNGSTPIAQEVDGKLLPKMEGVNARFFIHHDLTRENEYRVSEVETGLALSSFPQGPRNAVSEFKLWCQRNPEQINERITRCLKRYGKASDWPRYEQE